MIFRKGDRVVALSDQPLPRPGEIPVVAGAAYIVADAAGVKREKTAIVLLEGDAPGRWIPARAFVKKGE
jgi:hypothetical protein